jgi:nucleoside diphosphate kinase
MFMCCIIKPPAYHQRHEIKECLEERGLLVIRSKDLVYTRKLVEVLYDHMDSTARAEIAKRYEGHIGVALCIEAESIAACMNIIGTESDPRMCVEGTVRALYGTLRTPERIGMWDWWENALHRPVDEYERVRDLAYIFPEHAESAG